LKENAQNWINYTLNDPLVKILAKNCNLTKIQIETLLIDVLAENITDKSLKYDEKAKLRVFAVSRGAFNRSLRQARQNVTQSIYTILLLGYLGVLEEVSLEPYLEAANKLKTYINTQRELAKNKPKEEHIQTVAQLHEELRNSLEELANPRKLSKRL
jgi:polyribonucleotide nucleotidyltransferase